MGIQELREELNSKFKIRKILFKWLFGEIEFTREEFLSLFDMADHIAEIVNKSFVEAWVMHYDLTKEDPDRSIKSLFETAEFLDLKVKELRGKLDENNRSLTRLIEQLRSDIITHAKKIREHKERIDEMNRGEYESKYRLHPCDWLPDPLREMRLCVYPTIRSLIDLLPNNHPTKQPALDIWYSGRAILSERQKDEALPSWQLKRDV